MYKDIFVINQKSISTIYFLDLNAEWNSWYKIEWTHPNSLSLF